MSQIAVNVPVGPEMSRTTRSVMVCTPLSYFVRFGIVLDGHSRIYVGMSLHIRTYPDMYTFVRIAMVWYGLLRIDTKCPFYVV